MIRLKNREMVKGRGIIMLILNKFIVTIFLNILLIVLLSTVLIYCFNFKVFSFNYLFKKILLLIHTHFYYIDKINFKINGSARKRLAKEAKETIISSITSKEIDEIIETHDTECLNASKENVLFLRKSSSHEIYRR